MYELSAVIDRGYGYVPIEDFIGSFVSTSDASAASAMYLYHYYGIEVDGEIVFGSLIAIDDEQSIEFLLVEKG